MYLGGVGALSMGDHGGPMADLDGSWERGGAPTSRTLSGGVRSTHPGRR